MSCSGDVFDSIEQFYNSTQRHSTLGDISSVAFEPPEVFTVWAFESLDDVRDLTEQWREMFNPTNSA